MALTFELEQIVDYEHYCWEPAVEGSVIRKMRPLTERIIMMTMAVGIGTLTAKNADEFFKRLTLIELMDGCREPITIDDVRAHVGLRTNVVNETSAAWLKRQWDVFKPEYASHRWLMKQIRDLKAAAPGEPEWDADKNMARIPFVASLVVTPEDLGDLLTCALEGGINYWCARVEGNASALLRGTDALVFHLHDPDDFENGVTKPTLTRGRLLEGIQRWAKHEVDAGRSPAIDTMGSTMRLEMAHVDAGDADNILQCALFGRIVYG